MVLYVFCLDAFLLVWISLVVVCFSFLILCGCICLCIRLFY